MKTLKLFIVMTALTIAGAFSAAAAERDDANFKWQIDRFDDIKILRYKVNGFESLTLRQKELIYYLGEAAVSGRDIMFDQNFKYNLPIRRTLEAMYSSYEGDRNDPDFIEFEKYLKKVWFANGIHHHYSTDKFVPGFGEVFFDKLFKATPKGKLPTALGNKLLATIKPIIFDPGLYHKRINQDAGVDMVVSSACNYYEGVTQAEAEGFYEKMARPNDRQPISYGLNSKLTKEDGVLTERVWKSGGMYGAAIDKVVGWLEKAAAVAENGQQEQVIRSLIEYYRSGDLAQFDRYSVLWVKDTASQVDFVNGFIEVYGDPLGYKASWESLVNFKDIEATKRTGIISDNAQWFEDHSPIDGQFKKPVVKGVSAKVITAAMLGGDCYPATPIGINLPNADWIRRDHGSKSVTIANITEAYGKASAGDGFAEEFILRPEDRKLREKWGTLAGDLHTDLHECLGHGSGQLAPGIKGDELKNYGSPLEETRADLFALYYMPDPKLMELGIVPSADVARAEYNQTILNGMLTQLTRIQPGKDIEQAHMRNRSLIANWAYELGRPDNVIEKIAREGKTYVVINDYEKLRNIFGDMLREIQRIKSEGDFTAGKTLIETYGVKVDPRLHAEILDRYAKLDLAPYAGFVNPVYTPVVVNGRITDVLVDYPTDYIGQMLRYSADYSFLPDMN